MSLLDALLARMRVTPELTDIQVVENEFVDDETFAFKVRAVVIPGFLQIRFLADKSFERYSFQLYGDHPLLRWDNVPHFPGLPNFPHHFHDSEGNVSSSSLAGDLLDDFDVVMEEIRDFMKM